MESIFKVGWGGYEQFLGEYYMGSDEALVALGVRPFPTNAYQRDQLKAKIDYYYITLAYWSYLTEEQKNLHLQRVQANYNAAVAGRAPNLSLCDMGVTMLPQVWGKAFYENPTTLDPRYDPPVSYGGYGFAVGMTKAGRNVSTVASAEAAWINSQITGGNALSLTQGAREPFTRASTSIKTDWGFSPAQYDLFPGPNGRTWILPPTFVGTGGACTKPFCTADMNPAPGYTPNYQVEAMVGTYVDVVQKDVNFSCQGSSDYSCALRFGGAWSCQQNGSAYQCAPPIAAW
jgi:hypothetical protein